MPVSSDGLGTNKSLSTIQSTTKKKLKCKKPVNSCSVTYNLDTVLVNFIHEVDHFQNATTNVNIIT